MDESLDLDASVDDCSDEEHLAKAYIHVETDAKSSSEEELNPFTRDSDDERADLPARGIARAQLRDPLPHAQVVPESHLSLSLKATQVRSFKWALGKQIAADKAELARWREELRAWQEISDLQADEDATESRDDPSGPCADCGVTQSPIWRTGRRWGLGGLSLCNACGMQRLRTEASAHTDQQILSQSHRRLPTPDSDDNEDGADTQPQSQATSTVAVWNGHLAYVLDSCPYVAPIFLTANDDYHFPFKFLDGGAHRLNLIRADTIDNVALLARREHRPTGALATDLRVHMNLRDTRVRTVLGCIRANRKAVIARVENDLGTPIKGTFLAIFPSRTAPDDKEFFACFLPPKTPVLRTDPTFTSLPRGSATATRPTAAPAAPVAQSVQVERRNDEVRQLGANSQDSNPASCHKRPASSSVEDEGLTVQERPSDVAPTPAAKRQRL